MAGAEVTCRGTELDEEATLATCRSPRVSENGKMRIRQRALLTFRAANRLFYVLMAATLLVWLVDRFEAAAAWFDRAGKIAYAVVVAGLVSVFVMEVGAICWWFRSRLTPRGDGEGN
jgi:hypothetical protein